MTLDLDPNEAKLVQLALRVRARKYEQAKPSSDRLKTEFAEHAQTLRRVLDRFPLYLG